MIKLESNELICPAEICILFDEFAFHIGFGVIWTKRYTISAYLDDLTVATLIQIVVVQIDIDKGDRYSILIKIFCIFVGKSVRSIPPKARIELCVEFVPGKPGYMLSRVTSVVFEEIPVTFNFIIIL